MQVQRNILLNPGPATTTDSVKYSQVVPDICPREQEFGEMVDWIQKELVKFAGDPARNTCVMLGGSGTSAVEMTVSSVVPHGGALLIINNGAYAARIAKIANIHNIPVVEFVSSPSLCVDYDALEQCIISAKENFATGTQRTDTQGTGTQGTGTQGTGTQGTGTQRTDTQGTGKPTLTHLAAIHHETTSGLLNDSTKIGAICKKHGLSFILDAMSSYGAMPMDMDRDNIDYLISSSNKNIQGMAGIGIILCNIASLESTKDIKMRTLYLNLYDQYAYFLKTKQFRFTPPVQTMYALRQAIIETATETVALRYERYQKSYKTLRAGMEALGFRVLVADDISSGFITTFFDPVDSKYSFDTMHDYLYERGFTIYPGKVSTAGTFRIANIGDIDNRDIENFLGELKSYLTTHSITV